MGVILTLREVRSLIRTHRNIVRLGKRYSDYLIEHKEVLIMRKFFVIAVIALMALGCKKKDDEGTSKLPESEVASGQEAGAAQEPKGTPVYQ